MRKEPAADCVTPSNKLGLKEGHGIPNGEGLDIWQTLEKLKYNCWCFRVRIIRDENWNVSTRHRVDGSVEWDPGEIALALLGPGPGLQGRNTQVRKHWDLRQPKLSGNFRQNKAMLVVVFPFLRDYAAILDTSLDNMTVFLPDFSINDIQAALSKPFYNQNQSQLTAFQYQESTVTVPPQKPAGWIEF